jgi:uncharacterized protein YchJ
MDIRTGKLLTVEGFQRYVAQKPDEAIHFINVVRDTTKIERAAMQIALYSPCVCGSGKKFRFCCYRPVLAKNNTI